MSNVPTGPQWSHHQWRYQPNQRVALGGPGGQTVDTRSTSGVPLKTLGYNTQNSYVEGHTF